METLHSGGTPMTSFLLGTALLLALLRWALIQRAKFILSLHWREMRTADRRKRIN